MIRVLLYILVLGSCSDQSGSSKVDEPQASCLTATTSGSEELSVFCTEFFNTPSEQLREAEVGCSSAAPNSSTWRIDQTCPETLAISGCQISDENFPGIYFITWYYSQEYPGTTGYDDSAAAATTSANQLCQNSSISGNKTIVTK